MNKYDLQIFAGLVVIESKLGKEAKLQILEWLQNEASKVDLMGFLMDGRIKHFDENSEQVVIDRFEVHEAGGRVAKLRKSYMSQAGAGGGLNPGWLLYRTARKLFDACTNKCGSYEVNTSRRQHCMIKCNLIKLNKELQGAKKEGNEGKAKSIQKNIQKQKALLSKSSKSFSDRGAME